MAQVTAAVEADNLLLPLIDFAPFLSGDHAQRLAVANAITHGFKTAGFIYLKNTGVPPAVVASVFAHSAALFRLPQAQKDAIAVPNTKSNRGYGAIGREKLIDAGEGGREAAQMRSIAPDIKETFQMSREEEGKGERNLWPAEFPEFKGVMEDFFERVKSFHGLIMGAVALGLGLEEGFFDGYIDKGDNSLRLLHYPAVPKSVFDSNPNQVRCGAHGDYGSITLLFQDSRGGLQVRSPKGTFVDATPIPDTVVVNAGDLLARWSNDVIKSTLHRVVEPKVQGETAMEEYPARYSVAFFCQPNLDAVIESIPGTGEAKYPAITSGEYLMQRLTATY